VHEADVPMLLQPLPGSADEGLDERLRQRAREAFERCAVRRVPDAPLKRVQACNADLDLLPVVLLYRVDGLSRKEAAADLQRHGELDDGAADSPRVPHMLSFTYQGAAPVPGQGRLWIDQRQAEWTERCLHGRIKGLTP